MIILLYYVVSKWLSLTKKIMIVMAVHKCLYTIYMYMIFEYLEVLKYEKKNNIFSVSELNRRKYY